MLNTIWIILIIYLCFFGINISKKIKFKNYKIFKMIKKLNYDSLFLALGTKMGVGTIIGTTIAITVGGPGSLIWIYIFTILTSSIIYLESYLGNKYKQKINNSYISGIYYYTKFGLKNKLLSIIMLLIFITTYSCFFLMIQTNTISEILPINKIILASRILILLILLVTNKITQITKILNKIVPLMCIFFIIISLFIIIKNINIIDDIIKLIIKDAFNNKTIITGMVIGIKRSIFLNELLIGTTSMSSGINNISAETTANTLTLGTYFITFIISSLISFLVLIYLENGNIVLNYNQLLINVFTYHYNNIGLYFLNLLICLLSTTTIISGIYIGISNISYLTNNKCIINLVKIIMILSIISGIFINTNRLWNMLDNVMLILIILNTYIVTKLKNECS